MIDYPATCWFCIESEPMGSGRLRCEPLEKTVTGPEAEGCRDRADIRVLHPLIKDERGFMRVAG